MVYRLFLRSFCTKGPEWISKNLKVVSGDKTMTPELKLHLLKPECPMWSKQPDDVPFTDPFWMFYWPGGQALTRYIFDNPHVVRNKDVLDLGCGCGASALAARKCGAKSVTANDVDKMALVATECNAKLNGLNPTDIQYTDTDILSTKTYDKWNVVLVGDMFYDSEFATKILSWLKEFARKSKGPDDKQVLIGDPGRPGLHSVWKNVKLTTLAKYPLPAHMTREMYGMTTATIYRLE